MDFLNLVPIIILMVLACYYPIATVMLVVLSGLYVAFALAMVLWGVSYIVTSHVKL